jgi:uncharacterized membrane protein YeiH
VLLITLDLLGVFVFALSGALEGARHRLDFFGVVVIGTISSIGGGLIRDVVIGATPPAAIQDWRYLLAPFVAAAIAAYRGHRVGRLQRPIEVIDALGLGVFAVAGARKALDYGLSPLASLGVGVLSAVGGGLLRDVLLREVPHVLRPSEPYGLAALCGAMMVAGAELVHAPQSPAAVAGVLIVFAIRVVGGRRQWTTKEVTGQ